MAINDGYKELMEQVPHYKDQNSFGDDFFTWEEHNTINHIFPKIPVPTITRKRIVELQNLYGYQDRDIKRIANRCGMWRDNAVANYKRLKKDAGEKGSAKYWPEITIRPVDLCRIFHVTEDYLFGYSNDPMKKVFATWEELFKRLAKDYNLKSPKDVPKYAPPKSSVKYVYQTDPTLVNEVNRYRERINDFKFILRMGEAESHGLDADTLLYCIQRLEDRK